MDKVPSRDPQVKVSFDLKDSKGNINSYAISLGYFLFCGTLGSSPYLWSVLNLIFH